jgi:hypothetical protein
MKLVRGRYRLTLLIAAPIVSAFFALRTFLSPIILQTHTQFLFLQLEQAYRDSVTSGQPLATTNEQFIERIPQWTIDWNSCRFRDHAIFDSWGTAAKIRLGPSQIELRSAGPDRIFNTWDDITRSFPNSTGA